MKKLNLSLLLVASQAACASLFASGHDTLTVRAAPAAAQVTLDGSLLGPAPQQVAVPKRGGQSRLEVSAPGYQSATCRTDMTASAGYVAADVALCVLLFPLGCISFVDATGAWNHLDAPECHVTLRPDRPAESAPAK